jgi:hypothetical protein
VDRYGRNGASGGRKKIVPFGESSAHWLIATIACETGISPSELMNLPPRLLWSITRYLEFKNQAQANASKKSSGGRRR